jgi:zona occludens toxin
MLIFHEGLPGSGKSYEALVEHIIPSIKKDRKVFARINGLNYDKISELCDKPKEDVEQLLIHIDEDKVLEIQDHVENDSMVIIDELQNFFPSGRGKLSDGITKFVTEHRHRGIDIVAMGQSIADVHNLWRRRTQRKLQFLKLDMVGQAKRYKWTAFQGSLNAKGDVNFTKIKSGTKKYDEQYFGSYASHQANTDNTENYEDDRLNIFQSNGFKYGIPAAFVIGIYAIYTLYGFFSPGEPEQAPQAAQEQALPAQQGPDPSKPSTPNNEPQLDDFIQENDAMFNSKLTYTNISREYVRDMIVIWYDKTNKIKDRLWRDDFIAMGYTIKNVGYGIQITKGDYSTVYRMKPSFEPRHSIPNEVRQDLVSTN